MSDSEYSAAKESHLYAEVIKADSEWERLDDAAKLAWDNASRHRKELVDYLIEHDRIGKLGR